MTNTLITGAASGIGRALAEHLARAGHALVLVDVAPLDDVAPKAKCTRLIGNVADEEFWDQASEHLTGLTHAAINAGIARTATIADMPLTDWRAVMAVNLDGAFLTLRAAIRAIRRNTGERAIVVTGSVTGIKPEPTTGAYGASKAAVMHLARIAARELAEDHIRVNCIAPGGVDTNMWDTQDWFRDFVGQAGSREAAIAQLGAIGNGLGRYATSEEIAAQIAFLLSDKARTITGTVVTSDGGYSL